MTRDDIISMAREANGEEAWSGGVEWTWEEVERFAALVAAAELRKLHEVNVALVDALQLALETIERQSKNIDQVTGAVIEIGYAALSKSAEGQI